MTDMIEQRIVIQSQVAMKLALKVPYQILIQNMQRNYVQIVMNRINYTTYASKSIKNVTLNGFNKIFLNGLVKMIILTNLFKKLN